MLRRDRTCLGSCSAALRTPPNFNNLNTYTATGLQRPYRFPNPQRARTSIGAAYYDNPFFVLNNPGNRSELGRSIPNVNADWNPARWLNVKETLGADNYSDSRLEALPVTSAHQRRVTSRASTRTTSRSITTSRDGESHVHR